MMWRNRRARGAVSVFLVIIYLAAFTLMCVLVDGGRARMAKTEAEQIQQLANESLLTYYNRALYQYYGLFGETQYTTEQLAPLLRAQMEQALALKSTGGLAQAMGASWLFSTDGRQYFNPYHMKIGSDLAVGSNISLADKDAFRSQVNDVMKYKAPLLLANNFLNLVSGMQTAQNSVSAVKNCVDSVSTLTDDIKNFADGVTALKNELDNYCVNPDGALSAALTGGGSCMDLQQYAQEFDRDAKQQIDDLLNKIKDQMAAAGSGSSAPADDGAIAQALDGVGEKYTDKLQAVEDNRASLADALDSRIADGNALLAKISAQQADLRAKAATAASSDAGIYTSFADQYDNSAKRIRECLDGLAKQRDLLVQLGSGTPDAAAVRQAADALLARLKQSRDTDADSMAADAVVSAYDARMLRGFEQIEGSLGALNVLLDDEDSIANCERETQQKLDESKNNKQTVDENCDRLGRVPDAALPGNAAAQSDAAADPTAEKYDRSNAAAKASEVSGRVDGVCTTFLGKMSGDLMNNLFEGAYVESYFRDYVHTYKMADTTAADGSDTVPNAKFRSGDSYLSAGQFRSIETTCAEAEYVLFGNADTKADVAAMVASVLAMRLAFDYMSVYLVPGLRAQVLSAAGSAGIFAPAVLALMPFAYALPQAIADTSAIFNGLSRPLIYLNDEQWWTPDAQSGATMAGYSDYMMIFLVMMDQDAKAERMQTVVTMNLQKLDKNFALNRALVDIYASSSCSMDYLFMTQAFMPAGLRAGSGCQFAVNTSASY